LRQFVELGRPQNPANPGDTLIARDSDCRAGLIGPHTSELKNSESSEAPPDSFL